MGENKCKKPKVDLGRRRSSAIFFPETTNPDMSSLVSGFKNCTFAVPSHSEDYAAKLRTEIQEWKVLIGQFEEKIANAMERSCPGQDKPPLCVFDMLSQEDAVFFCDFGVYMKHLEWMEALVNTLYEDDKCSEIEVQCTIQETISATDMDTHNIVDIIKRNLH